MPFGRCRIRALVSVSSRNRLFSRVNWIGPAGLDRLALLSNYRDFFAKTILPSESAVTAFVFAHRHPIDSMKPGSASESPERASSGSVSDSRPGGERAQTAGEDARLPAAERQMAQLAQGGARLEEELAALASQLKQTQEASAKLERARQSLVLESGQLRAAKRNSCSNPPRLSSNWGFLSQALGEPRS